MGDLIRTGAAAKILGTSRQHVVDLVDRGALTNYGHGVHRRVDRWDVEALVGHRRPPDERFRLWLHVAVAGEIVREPARSIAKARANLMIVERELGGRTPETRRWLTLLAAGPESILRVLTESSPDGDRMRQASPWLALLGPADVRHLRATFSITDRPALWTRPDRERSWPRRSPRLWRPLPSPADAELS